MKRATTFAIDSGPGSLRQALAEANDGDTIDFAVTGSIGLTNGELLVVRASQSLDLELIAWLWMGTPTAVPQ